MSRLKKRNALVVQWSKICLLVQGTRVPSLVSEDPPIPWAAKFVFRNLNLQKTWSLVFCFVLFCLNQTTTSFKILHVLIIRFQNTKLVLHTVPMERPPQQDSHRCCHEWAAGCPPPLFSAWAATGF